ncbi:replication-associated protein [Avon-Heathcote Estuary associated circular virus 23]|uniref:replication-associated protein n=1 Tax=Avon-Heathcote Estuary associated circular virus 23 TaxID=1618247 RepID=UPI0005CCB629|nr:replication-associated protein [Avon-Heathcote Estuary associated circular virus 23]AJP36458.1 replication-associated protein [Avon-Heathcote Estuary associated circular virus 23]
MTARNWCFTLNNPTEHIDFKSEKWMDLKLAIYMMEKGETGTPHFQGYLEMKEPQRMSFFKKLMPRAHLEKRRGSKQQAINYVLKTMDPECSQWEITMTGEQPIITGLPVAIHCKGTPHDLLKSCEPKKSLKERLEDVKELIRSGYNDEQIMESHYDLFVRYHRAFALTRRIMSSPRDHEMKVIVCQGPTGTGKSRWAKETYPNAYWKQRSQWWCGYEGQDTIVLDEFYGWLQYDLLLRLCDRYPLYLETKGGQVNCKAKTIVITTNATPESWYKTEKYFLSFIRRVSEWRVFPIWGEMETYVLYSEAVSKFFLNTE